MPAPLSTLLSMMTSGANVFSPEQLQLYGGKDAILNTLRSIDPNASAVDTETSGGEGGSGPMGVRFDFDISKAPKSDGGTLGLDLRASNFGKLKNPNAVYDDKNYGSVTNSANVYKPTDPLWVHLAPILVSTLAPMAGAALAGAGIGGAGLTAAATGSGLTGASSLPSWLTSQLAKAPSYAGQLANGNFNPVNALLSALTGQVGNMTGVDPRLIKTGMTLAQLARRGR